MAQVVLTGTIVTMDEAQPVIEQGAVYVGDGRIIAVRRQTDPAPAGFDGVQKVATGETIYPGLIDMHSHMAYNTLPLWSAAGVPYAHHDRWPDEDRDPPYSTAVSWPAKVLGQAAAEALIKYVEVKALIGGTTALQGAPRTTRPVQSWLVRIVDNEDFGSGTDRVLCAALQRSVEKLRTDSVKLRQDGCVLIYHMAEGVVDSIVHREFDELDAGGCLHPGLIGVHATALVPDDFSRWQTKVRAVNTEQRGTIVWSPFSNLWLYHTTTDVADAHSKGMRIALGSDWSPSGTKHVLGELKVADIVNRDRFHGAFTDAELCAMVTANPGDAMAVAYPHNTLGRLRDGAEADLLVLERHHPDPHRNLIEATERHVRLVMVRGAPYYGTPGLMKATGAPPGDPFSIDGRNRVLVVRRPGQADATLNWPEVRAALERVRADPVAAWRSSQEALAAWGGSLDDT
jgi:5-methylthioadenosine/S-adenosylhomocysteine deaminase